MNGETIRLGDLLELVAMGPFGSDLKTDNFRDSGVPVIRGGNLSGFYVSDTDLVFVTEEKADSLSRSVARPGDLVITHRGTLGQVSMVPRNGIYDRFLVSQSQMLLRVDTEKVIPEYLTYWMRSKTGQNSLLAFAVQTGVPALAQPTKSIKALQMVLPSVAGQRAIAEVLGALDDKITANHVVIEASLALGTALVGSAEMSLERLEAVADITMGTSPRGEELNEDSLGVPFYQGVRDFGALSPALRVFTDRPVRIAHDRSTLFAVRAPVGRVNFSEDVCAIGRGVAGLHSAKHPSTLFFALRRHEDAWGAYEGSGTVFASINKRELAGTALPFPQTQVRDELESRLALLLDRTRAAEQENIRLARTRDELLAALMSGRITVKDAESRVEKEV